MALLFHVVMKDWDRFEGIKVIALMELNRLMTIIERYSTLQSFSMKFPELDPRLRKLLDLDFRVSLTWDADLTDIDLWILEPNGDKAYYENKQSRIGGLVSNDFTDGYGPEEYCLKVLVPGLSQIQAKYFGSGQQSLIGPATLKATIYTNYGRIGEERKEITLRLDQVQEVLTIGEIHLKPSK